jgi:hypothetical protein
VEDSTGVATTLATSECDRFGRPIAKTAVDQTAHCLWDGDQLLAE